MPNDDPLIQNVPVTPTTTPFSPYDTQVEKPKPTNKFLDILKGIGGAALGVFAPGLGGLLGGVLGSGPNFGTMQGMIQQQQRFSMQLLSVQHQVGTQSQEFTAVSNLLKARHDSEMSAVNNFKS
jgi:hypothetical protein